MAVATPIFPQTIRNPVAQILPADTTTLKALVAGGVGGTKVESINVSSTDTSARDLALWMTVSAVNYLIGTVSIPINAGNTNAIPAVSLLDSAQIPSMRTDNNGNKYIYVASGATLSISTLTTVTAAKAIQAVAQAGDF